MSHEDSKNDYAIFISYSSKSDSGLARNLHAFFGSFHRTATAKKAGLGEKALNACWMVLISNYRPEKTRKR